MRGQGGYIGFNRTAATTAASGIWTLREAEAMRRAGTWPSAPTVPGTPTSLSATGGNAQVALSWTAPADNGGTAITDYAVQFSSDSGSTWSTFADGTSTTTSATVTGLTNGTAYVFRVAATNSAGTGAYTAASSSVTPSAATVPGTVINLRYTQEGCANQDKPYIAQWSAPTSDGGSAITGYAYKFTEGGSVSTTASPSLSFIGSSVATVYVAAVNAAGTGAFVSITGFQDC